MSIVENPEIRPMKDYLDYTKHVNEELSHRRYYISLIIIFIDKHYYKIQIDRI
jgi:hypothetical protein